MALEKKSKSWGNYSVQKNTKSREESVSENLLTNVSNIFHPNDGIDLKHLQRIVADDSSSDGEFVPPSILSDILNERDDALNIDIPASINLQ